MDIYSKLKKTYYKALDNLNSSDFKSKPEVHKKAFASCVATLCHDDLTVNEGKRMSYLIRFMQLTGGPTVREHYCQWMAFGRGDAIRGKDNDLNLTAFDLDQRFKIPGTWSYREAYNFCLIHVFAELNELHKEIYKVESCFDDTVSDLLYLEG